MTRATTADVDVRGGSHGVQADTQALTALARTFGDAGSETLRSALGLHAYLVDPDIALAGLVDPAGTVAFEAALGAALDGPAGLSWAGARCEAADGLLRSAALAYSAVDTLWTDGKDAVQGMLDAPVAVSYLVYQLVRTHDLAGSLQRTVTRFPELADTVTPAVLDLALAAAGLPPDPRAAARLMPDGHGVAVYRGEDTSRVDTTAPRSLTDLVAGLARRNQLADNDHGEIDVRFVHRSDGTRSVIVDVTGTKCWSPGRTSDITSLATNGRALYGDRTSYEQGVLQAMRRAGVTPDEPVMIIGHSEGGMVAITAARDAVLAKQFNVTHVITAGSPIGRSAGSVPSTVRVLALENTRDLVPHLDGRANPDRLNVLTVRGARGGGTVTDDHSLEHGYLPLARDAQASDDPSVQEYLRSCGRYFDGTTTSTQRYQIVRSLR